MTDQSTPQTEAGRRLVEAGYNQADILLVETEAAQAHTEALDVRCAHPCCADKEPFILAAKADR